MDNPLAARLSGPILVKRTSLRSIFERLYQAFGPQYWWPSRSPFETMVGAILAQATNWRNVEQAIHQLRRSGGLSPQGLLALRTTRLERLIRSAGYFRQKARRLKGFARWYVRRFRGDPNVMFNTPPWTLRQEFLGIHGIGPETADSMLLYAGGQPVFVIDTYTTRVFRRHRLVGARAGYDEIQQFAMHRLPKSPTVYNEFHALLVAVGKRFCHRRHPDCEHCPLGDLPHTVEVS